MHEVKWTDDQKKVLTHRGSSLLVSAAAGSGKTAVLVERVIRRICDPEEHAEIDEFLIVTFTSAAAAEMKAKIYAAIADRLALDPTNRRLRRQLTLLSSAQMSTVHAFCQSLIREHFEMLGLSPDFRIADELEANTLKASVLNALIEDAYKDGTPEFHALVDVLSAARDDKRMVKVILDIYEKLRSHPFPDRWTDHVLSELSLSCHEDPSDTIFGRTILKSALSRLRSVQRSYSSILLELKMVKALQNTYYPSFADDVIQQNDLLSRLEKGDWDGIRDALRMISFVPLKSAKNYEDRDHLEMFKTIRKRWISLVKDLSDKLFSVTASEARSDFQATIPLARELFRLVSAFEVQYSDAKRRKNLLDFSDLEHFAVQLLVSDSVNGVVTPTPLARQLSERFLEIMVDEYQDTNEVQDSIFKAISKNETNLFMVGDIKQSIYGFRLADPSLFLDKYLKYQEDAIPGTSRKILLSKNFRSRKEVLDSVNFTFRVLMSDTLGDLFYTPAEYLYPGKEYPDATSDVSTELLLTETYTSDDNDSVQEAATIARRIKTMCAGSEMVTDKESGLLRPVEYGDIVILLRSQSSKAATYIEALAKLGIPCRSDASEPLFDTLECSTALAFLSVIDNPDNDLPLTAVMRCPVYRFTTDELAVIRANTMKGSYLKAVTAYAADGERTVLRQKCSVFLEQLQDFRLRASNLSAARLLWHIYEETSLLARYGAMSDGADRQANLIALFDLAGRFEQMGYKGLYAFVRYIDKIREGDDTSKIPSAQRSTTGAVTIMSIHRSKGLEFPVVIVPDCSKRFNLKDFNEPILLHSKLGVGFKAREATRRVEYPTLARTAIALLARQEMLSEELRILYVAMTRAKEKLILSGSVNVYDKYISDLRAELGEAPPTPELLVSKSNILPWLLYPLLAPPTIRDEICDTGKYWSIRVVTPDGENAVANTQPATAALPTPDAADLSQLLRTRSYVYPHANAVNTPSKATATGLKGRYLDEEAVRDATAVLSVNRIREPKKPAFLSEAGLSPSQRGTAHHLAMQFMDFDKTGSVEAVRQEITRLYAHGYLSKAQSDAVNPRKIYAFFKSKLGQSLLASKTVERELKFSLLTSPETINAILRGETPDPCWEEIDPADKILLQGVIDCWFETADGLTLIDFKTDFCSPGGEAAIAEKYRGQLACYAYALERITRKPVKTLGVYLFHTETSYLF